MMNRNENVIDFLKNNVMKELKDIDTLAFETHMKLLECVDSEEQKYTDELANFELTRMYIEHIKEILGFYN